MSGIIRRIDHLGRVVIPKEMRRALRLKDCDPLEIFLQNEEIVFKKYSPIENVNNFASSVAKNIEEITQKFCFITDADKVIYASPKYKACVGNSISKALESAMNDRKSILLLRSEGAKSIAISETDEFKFTNQLIVPIISGGDCYGSVIVVDEENKTNFNAKDLNLVRLGANILAEQFNI